jgi:hypothetical protein
MKTIKNINFLMLIVLICFSITGCSQSKSIEDGRKETMEKIIKGFIANDSIVYILIDTSACYSLTGKERFIGDAKSLHEIFSKNRILDVNKDNFKYVSSNPADRYKITFSLQTGKFDSLVVNFNFLYGIQRKVYFFDVVYFPKPGNEEPLEKVRQDR